MHPCRVDPFARRAAKWFVVFHEDDAFDLVRVVEEGAHFPRRRAIDLSERTDDRRLPPSVHRLRDGRRGVDDLSETAEGREGRRQSNLGADAAPQRPILFREGHAEHGALAAKDDQVGAVEERVPK